MITEAQAQELASELGVKYIETSAKANTNVEEAFFSLARDVKARLIDSAQGGAAAGGTSGGAGDGKGNVNVGATSNQGPMGNCCSS